MASSSPVQPRVATTALALAALLVFGASCGGPPAADRSPAPIPGAPDGAGETNLRSGCVTDFDPEVDYFPEKVSFDRASGVDVTYSRHYKTVTVSRPWPGAPAGRTYVLVQCGTPSPDLAGPLAGATAIEVPVGRAVTMSTTYLPHFDALGAVETLAGVGTTGFVYTASVRERIEAGAIVETGEGAGANLEVLLDLEPDVVIAYSFTDPASDGIERMAEAGITVVLANEWLEEHPLGRAEWVKFTGLLLNREGDAEALFHAVVDDYERLRAQAAGAGERPKVLLNTPFEGTWYVPAGGNYMAIFIADAGADYPWADTEGSASLAVDIEVVLDRAADADVWVNAGFGYATLADMRAVDERFDRFHAFELGKVYANDARMSPGGGVDFFETGVTRPDLVLADLVHILHPELVPGHELVFYRRVPGG